MYLKLLKGRAGAAVDGLSGIYGSGELTMLNQVQINLRDVSEGFSCRQLSLFLLFESKNKEICGLLLSTRWFSPFFMEQGGQSKSSVYHLLRR